MNACDRAEKYDALRADFAGVVKTPVQADLGFRSYCTSIMFISFETAILSLAVAISFSIALKRKLLSESLQLLPLVKTAFTYLYVWNFANSVKRQKWGQLSADKHLAKNRK